MVYKYFLSFPRFRSFCLILSFVIQKLFTWRSTYFCFSCLYYWCHTLKKKKKRKSKKAAGQNLNLSSMAAQGLYSGSLVRQHWRLCLMVSVDEGLAPCPRRWALKLSGSLARLFDQVGLKIMLHYWVELLILYSRLTILVLLGYFL